MKGGRSIFTRPFRKATLARSFARVSGRGGRGAGFVVCVSATTAHTAGGEHRETVSDTHTNTQQKHTQ